VPAARRIVSWRIEDGLKRVTEFERGHFRHVRNRPIRVGGKLARNSQAVGASPDPA